MSRQIILSIPITFLVAALWLRLLQRLIPYRKDKTLPAGVGTFFLFGLLSLPLFPVLSFLYPDLWIRPTSLIAHAWNHVIMVGILEELTKWLIFALVMHVKKPLRSPEDGVFFGAATALAFATIENVLYADYYGLRVLWVRSILTTAGHMSYGALWGFVWAGVTWEGAGEINREKFPWAIAAIIPVGILHGFYNTSLVFGLGAGILVDAVTLILVVAAYRYLLTHSPYRKYPYRESARAVEELSHVLRLNPGSRILRRRRGMHYLRLQEYGKAEEDFRASARTSAAAGRALDLLALVALYAQDRSLVDAAEIEGLFASLSPGQRQALRRELPPALRSNRPLEREIIKIIAGKRERPEAYRSRTVRRVSLFDRRRAVRNLQLMERTEQERRDAEEVTYRRRILSEEERRRLTAAMSRSAAGQSRGTQRS